MLQIRPDYAATCQAFEWMIPTHYNIGVDACDKWADGSGRTALIYQTAQGQEQPHSFDQFKDWTDRFAQAFRAPGLNTRDSVGNLLPQSPAHAIATRSEGRCGEKERSI